MTRNSRMSAGSMKEPLNEDPLAFASLFASSEPTSTIIRELHGGICCYQKKIGTIKDSEMQRQDTK